MPLLKREFSISDLDLLSDSGAVASRKYFHAFRRYMTPTMLWGWWVERLSVELQRFHFDLRADDGPSWF